jgi:hypothetical protein
MVQVTRRRRSRRITEVEQELEQPVRRSIDTSEVAAHAALRLVAEYPGCMGRTRAVRVLRGLEAPVPGDDVDGVWAVADDWTVRDTSALVDAMTDGGLVTVTPGARPTLVLTRSGHRALDALECK